MNCRRCKREIPENSIFCNWCGQKQLREKNVISVPQPKRLADGTYAARLMVKGNRVWVYGDTPQEYYAKARAMKAELIKAASTKKMTVGEAIDAYLASNSNVLSPSTLRGYKTYRNNRMQNAMELNIYDDIDWQSIINDELEEVMPKTVRNTWFLISPALKAQKVILPDVNLPVVVKDERPWLDFKQIKVFCEAVYGKPCELAALLALHSLRRSEILSITPRKIKHVGEQHFITVRGSTVYNADNELVSKATNKNDTSNREIPIMIPRLLELIPSRGNDPVVTIAPTNLWRYINNVCEEANLPLVGVHGLRHSFASLCYHLNWDIETTMRYGGWKSRDVVMNVYTHQASDDIMLDVASMNAYYSDFYHHFTTK